MKKTKLILSTLTIASFLVGSAINPPLASAQTNEDVYQKQLYDNKELFEQLSGAAQSVLGLKFGQVVAPASRPTPGGTSTESLSAIEEDSNILVNNPGEDHTAQDTQSETTLVVFGPGGNGNTACSGFVDSGSLIGSGGVGKLTGFSQSTNGGETWTDNGVLPTATNDRQGDGGDPVLARSSRTGTIFLSTLRFSGSGVRVFPSTDNCSTFAAPVEGAPGKSGGLQDKPWIAVDNFSGSGQGNVYLVERDTFALAAGISFFRSTDDGATFGPSGGTLIASAATHNVQGAFVTVGPDHAVYVFFFDQSSPQAIRMRRSTDQGLTFGATVTVATLATTGVNGDLGLGGGFRTNTFPQAAVNPVNGNIYAVFNNKGAGADTADIFFTQSTDAGATWSAPVRVNDDTGTNDQWQPTIAVRPDGAHLFISFYDRRLDPNNSLIDVFGAIGDISGSSVTFEPNFRITDTSFPVVIGQDPAVSASYMGDYDQSAADNNFFYVTWGDNRLPNPNFPAHTHQPDVRFAKFLEFAGIPGEANCHGKSVSALAHQFGGLNAAAAALEFSSVTALQDAIAAFCGE
jgi:hypothetical protein